MMELTLKQKNSDLLEILLNRKDIAEESGEVLCENFAYKKTLLFYANDCKYCRYAKKVGNNSHNAEYLCTYAIQAAENHAG